MANNPNVKDNLRNFASGSDPRRNLEGRPRKFVSLLKAQGYKLSEINDCIKNMLSMTKDELKSAIADSQATVMEIMIARSIFASIRSGNLQAFETLVARTYGKPKEILEVSFAPEVEAAKSLYESLIKNGVRPKTAIKKVIAGAKANGVELSEIDILDADTIG